MTNITLFTNCNKELLQLVWGYGHVLATEIKLLIQLNKYSLPGLRQLNVALIPQLLNISIEISQKLPFLKSYTREVLSQLSYGLTNCNKFEPKAHDHFPI